MHRFWNALIEPLIQIIHPQRVVEIGSDKGNNTRNLLAWCHAHDAVLHVIDPLPKYDPDAWQKEHGDRLVFHRGLSLNMLQEVEAAQLVLIDGDHNWYTVFHELQLIERRMKALGAPMPCILLHDLGWPYARRDLYYAPETIPEKYRKPYARKGLSLDSRELVDEGGMNPHLDHSLHESDVENGVLTAVEDYLKKTRYSFRFINLEGINGLGVLIPEKLIAKTPGLEAFAGQWTFPENVTLFQKTFERDRLRIETERQVQRRKVLDQEKLIVRKNEQAKALGEKINEMGRLTAETNERLEQHQAELTKAETAMRNHVRKQVAADQALEAAHLKIAAVDQQLADSLKALKGTQGQLEAMRLSAQEDLLARHELEKGTLALQERTKYLDESVSEKKAALKELQTERKAAETRINEILHDKYQLEIQMKDFEIRTEELKNFNLQLEKRADLFEKERESDRTQINQLKGRIAEASRQQEMRTRELQEKSQEISRLGHRRNEAERTVNLLKQELETKAHQLISLEARREEQLNQFDILQMANDQQAQALDQLRQENALHTTALTDEQAKYNSLTGSFNKLEQQHAASIDSLEKEIAEKRKLESSLEVLIEKQQNIFNELSRKDNMLAKKDNELSLKDNALAQKDDAVAHKDNELSQKESAVLALKEELATNKAEWVQLLRKERSESSTKLAEQENTLLATRKRIANEELKILRLQEQNRALRKQESSLAQRNRDQEKESRDNQLDFKRACLNQQLALNSKAIVAIDFLSRYRLPRRLGDLGLSIAKRVMPNLNNSLAKAKAKRETLSAQKSSDRRKGYQRRVNDLMGITNQPVPPRHKKPKISVIAWDIGHNPLGRAYLLADLFCNRKYDAEMIGAQFPKYGHDVWSPLKNMRLPLRRFPGRMFPDHFSDLEKMASQIDGDVIYVSKPRIPSLLLGILAKLQRNRPLILDIDDYELSFFRNREPLSLDQLKRVPRDKHFLNPHENLWTRFAESLLPYVDHITVSNHVLQKKYGGTILPHVRNSEHFSPSLYDRDAIRKDFGYSPEDRVILFIGTPRLHKGFLDIVEALETLDKPNYKLCIIGSIIDKDVKDRMGLLSNNRVSCFPNSPFEELPRNLCIGDLICILQDPNREVSAYQMPAKVTDALSMGIPVLATNVPPLKPLAARGLVELLNGLPLPDKIDEIFSNYPEYKAKANENRLIYSTEYAYVVNRERLWNIFSGLIENTPAFPEEFRHCVDFMRAEFSGEKAKSFRTQSAKDNKKRRRHQQKRARDLVDDKINIVFFWKQNDSDIYGRRQDMMVKYLADHPKVNKIIHFDAPIEHRKWMSLLNFKKNRKYDQRSLIFFRTLKRIMGLSNSKKVTRSTYVYLGRKDCSNYLSRKLFGRENGYVKFIRNILDKHHVWDRRTVFWVCPANFQFPRIREKFMPDLVVADVIDDQRKWPCRDKYRQRLQANYENILGSSDLVIANCNNVKHSMSPYCDRIEVIPNACEYFNGHTASLKKPSIYRKYKGPIIGYVGNLDSTRLDIELIEYLARKRPHWQINMIGSLHMNRDILSLQKFNNIHFLGVIPYDKALAYIKHFDVAIIPHIDNQMTQSMNPLKMYVYSSLGVPIVSTKIKNMEGMKDAVHIAGSRSTFMKKVELCLKNGKDPSRSESMNNLLKNNSWGKRVEEVIENIFDHPVIKGDQ